MSEWERERDRERARERERESERERERERDLGVLGLLERASDAGGNVLVRVACHKFSKVSAIVYLLYKVNMQRTFENLSPFVSVSRYEM